MCVVVVLVAEGVGCCCSFLFNSVKYLIASSSTSPSLSASPISASSSQPSSEGPEVSHAALSKARRVIGTLTRKVQSNF
jgi:hypothetical protein